MSDPLISRVDAFVASLLDEADRDKEGVEGGSGADTPAFAERVALLRVVAQYLSVRNGLEGATSKGTAQIDEFTDELAQRRVHRKIGRRTSGPAPRA